MGKPNAYATIQAAVTPVVMDQLPILVQDAFSLGTSVGVQLDTIAKYVGVTRNAKGAGGALVTLSDTDFTALIRMAIVRNMAGSSLATIQNLIHQYFPNQLFVYDGADMQMSYLMSSSLGSETLALVFVAEGLLPKPMGVQLASLIYLPTLEIFGFRTYHSAGANIFPFNTYADYETTWHFLSYTDTVILV